MSRMAIIPARRDSVRLPNKNKLKLCGKEMVRYTIEAAINSKLFDIIVVTSDDLEILEMTYDYWETDRVQPNRRPKYLCKHYVVLKHVCRFVLAGYGGYDEICLLQPTSPCRTSEDIIDSYEHFKGHNYLVSVSKHDKDKFKYDNGAINWANTREFINNFQDGWYGEDAVPYLLDTVDIDTMEDFKRAEKCLSS